MNLTERAGRGRSDGPEHGETTRPKPLSQREVDALLSAETLQALQLLQRTSTDLFALLRGSQLVNGVLDAQTLLLDTNGQKTLTWHVPAGSVAVRNYSAADVYVTNSASGSTQGRGVGIVPAGGFDVFPVASTEVSLTGSAGAKVNVVAYTGVMPPASARPGTGGGGSTGTPTATAAALSSVAGSASSVSLLAANSSRKGATIFNDSTANLYVAFSATASTTAFTVKIVGGGYYELPSTAVWTGAVSGIWDTATGSARVTELS